MSENCKEFEMEDLFGWTDGNKTTLLPLFGIPTSEDRGNGIMPDLTEDKLKVIKNRSLQIRTFYNSLITKGMIKLVNESIKSEWGNKVVIIRGIPSTNPQKINEK